MTQTIAIINVTTRMISPFIKSEGIYPYWYVKYNPKTMIPPPCKKVYASDFFMAGSSSTSKKYKY